MPNQHLYKICFVNKAQVYELYVRKVQQSDMLGFIEISDFVFGEKTAIVIDPSEERLKDEFQGVHSSIIPVSAVIRIDAVEKRGSAKIVSVDGNVTSLYPPSATAFTASSKPDGTEK